MIYFLHLTLLFLSNANACAKSFAPANNNTRCILLTTRPVALFTQLQKSFNFSTPTIEYKDIMFACNDGRELLVSYLHILVVCFSIFYVNINFDLSICLFLFKGIL